MKEQLSSKVFPSQKYLEIKDMKLIRIKSFISYLTAAVEILALLLVCTIAFLLHFPLTAACEWKSSNSYSCICASGFSGKYCQLSDACDFQNGGCSHECRRTNYGTGTGGHSAGNAGSSGSGGSGVSRSAGVTAGDVIGMCYCPSGLTLGSDLKKCMTQQQR